MSPFDPPRAAYLHVPFCAHKCGYCNFTVVAGRDDLTEAYLRAIEMELSRLQTPRPVDTLYFGGGTPTHLAPDALRTLCETAASWFPLAAGGEWTVEANPIDLAGDGVAEKTAVLQEVGVTRVSLGAQSFDDAKLRVLERDHRADDIETAARAVRAIGADLAIDLIFAAPRVCQRSLAAGRAASPAESRDVWRRDLERALALAPDHVSVYGLTFDRGASFFGRRERGDLIETDEETQRAMYLEAIDALAAAVFEHYEVSNFARTNKRSRHNQVYWRGDPYFAVGPGAARYVDGARETNHQSTTTYIRRVLAGESPVAQRETLSPEDRARELLVFSLRRLEGVTRGAFTERTSLALDKLAGPAIARFVALGLLHDDGDRVQLTREGLLISDALWPELL